MLNRCSENYIETTSKEHVEIPSGKRRQKNFHFQPVCQRCFNATGHIGLTLNQRQNACRVGPTALFTLLRKTRLKIQTVISTVLWCLHSFNLTW